MRYLKLSISFYSFSASKSANFTAYKINVNFIAATQLGVN